MLLAGFIYHFSPLQFIICSNLLAQFPMMLSVMTILPLNEEKGAVGDSDDDVDDKEEDCRADWMTLLEWRRLQIL